MIPRLGVNIDHVATLRQLRGTPYPDLLNAARVVESSGAAQITVHLREDRRHIQDADVRGLKAQLKIPLNLEMAASDEMVRIARRIKPTWSCLVPEKRQEVTTEGGLAVEKQKKRLGKVIESLRKAGIRVSLFIEPTVSAVKTSAELGAHAVELHTGRYGILTQKWKYDFKNKSIQGELKRVLKAAETAKAAGMGAHAGHGLDYLNVRELVALGGTTPILEEYNIGHSMICRAVDVGLGAAVREMVSLIQAP